MMDSATSEGFFSRLRRSKLFWLSFGLTILSLCFWRFTLIDVSESGSILSNNEFLSWFHDMASRKLVVLSFLMLMLVAGLLGISIFLNFHRAQQNCIFTVVCWATASVSIILLGVLLVSIGVRGFQHLDLSFLTDPPSRLPKRAGLGPAILGSVFICTVCGLVALPLGVGTAVFLEEYKPRSWFVQKIHGFIQLNISNLAGVPSIVYGILGLTAFVHMWGAVGSPNQPAFEMGVAYFDQFINVAGDVLYVPIDESRAPLTIPLDGLTAFDQASTPVTITVAEPAEAVPSNPPPGMVPADAIPSRISDKAWYTFRLPFGRGVLAGGLTLMLIILPIVIISSQEAIRAVPSSLREGAFGLGATRWQMVRQMTLPAAVPGIMTGAILSMSRAIGEAAPILIIAGTVYVASGPGHLMDTFTAMPLQIYNWAGRPDSEFHKVAASGIIVLLAVLLTFNAAAVFVRQKFQKPLQ